MAKKTCVCDGCLSPTDGQYRIYAEFGGRRLRRGGKGDFWSVSNLCLSCTRKITWILSGRVRAELGDQRERRPSGQRAPRPAAATASM